jgi:hypothetical protein
MDERRIGLYFLADDGVYDWVVAFLESLRTWDPDLPCLCIPFSSRFDRLAALAGRYAFRALEHPAFAALDALGKRLSHRPQSIATNMFRKFAMFDGPFDAFAYFDADTLILDPLTPRIHRFAESEVDFAFPHPCPEQVYTPARWERESSAFGSRGFNAGVWMGRRHGVALPDVLGRFADEAEPLKADFAPTWDQPFMNYCVDHAGLTRATFAELFPEPHHCLWGGEQLALRPGERPGAVVTPDGRQVILAHWAGFGVGTRMPYRWLFEQYRFRGRPFAKVAWRVGHRLAPATRVFRRAVGRLRKMFSKPGGGGG